MGVTWPIITCTENAPAADLPRWKTLGKPGTLLHWHIMMFCLHDISNGQNYFFNKINSVEENYSSQCLALYVQYVCVTGLKCQPQCCNCPVFERTKWMEWNCTRVPIKTSKPLTFSSKATESKFSLLKTKRGYPFAKLKSILQLVKLMYFIILENMCYFIVAKTF